MKIGYVRVSTKEQNEARQVNAMIEDGIELSQIYMDKQSGKDFEREQYIAMIKALRTDDILVIKSIDRLGRNYDAIRKEFSKLTDRGVIIHVLDMPILNTDQTMAPGLTGKFIADIVLNILGFVAEQERDNIRQRQREGIRAAKLAGKRFGRPSKLSSKFSNMADSVKFGKLTVIQACQLLGISRKTFYNHAKESGYDFSQKKLNDPEVNN